MQPLAEVTLTRPWHWGIAVLGDPVAEVPSDLRGGVVAVGQGVVVRLSPIGREIRLTDGEPRPGRPNTDFAAEQGSGA